MRIKQKRLGLFLMGICYASLLYPQSQVQVLRASLIERLSQVSNVYKTPVPPIFLDQGLPSNASYKPDSIILGNVQMVFQSFDDSLSLIYHEYIHHILYKSQKYGVALDSKGTIIQWLTDENYSYTPFPEEVAYNLKQFEKNVLPGYPNYEQMNEQEKGRILAEMERDLAKKQMNPFKYAPSNLAKEEIFVYKQQLKGERLGLFVLSEEARQNLHLRIKQFKITYKQRRAYEKKHKLCRNGEYRRK